VSVGVTTTESCGARTQSRLRRPSCSPGVGVGVPFVTGSVRLRASSAVRGAVQPARSSWNPRPIACVARIPSSSSPPSRRRSGVPWDDSATGRAGKARPLRRRSPGPPDRRTIYRPYLVGLTWAASPLARRPPRRARGACPIGGLAPVGITFGHHSSGPGPSQSLGA